MAAPKSTPSQAPSSPSMVAQIGEIKTVMNRYTHCRDCGGFLHFTYMTDFARGMAVETTRCPECGDRARETSHKLQ